MKTLNNKKTNTSRMNSGKLGQLNLSGQKRNVDK